MALFAIASASSASLPQVPADGALPLIVEVSAPQASTDVYVRPSSLLRHPKLGSGFQSCAYDPPLLGLDHNFHHPICEQHERMQHVQHLADLASGPPSMMNHADDEENERTPASPRPIHQPVLTKLLLLGYQGADGALGSPIKRSAERGREEHICCKSPQVTASKSLPRDEREPCARSREGPMEWTQNALAQVLGTLAVFLIIVLIVESIIYISHACYRRRAFKKRRGRLGLEGDERQLRAFAGMGPLKA